MYILKDIKNRHKYKPDISDVRYWFLKPSDKALYEHVKSHVDKLTERVKYSENEETDKFLREQHEYCKKHDHKDHHNDHKASWGHDVGWEDDDINDCGVGDSGPYGGD